MKNEFMNFYLLRIFEYYTKKVLTLDEEIVDNIKGDGN